MAEYQIVHKVLYAETPDRTIALVKFVDPKNTKDTRFFIGTFDVDIESVDLSELTDMLLPDVPGVEVSPGTLDIFIFKDDYDEHDLLSDDDLGVAVRLKE